MTRRRPLAADQRQQMLKVKFPPKLKMLFRRHRYKVAYGGRGSGKSWSYARALLIQGAQRKLRILCTREVQKSIKDSVHKLLKDQIESMGLGYFYDVLDNIIRGKNGTEFLFSGLSDQTDTSIKSYEGVDICWCEEAQTISKRAWNILIPTIRKPGSEIWISFNPELDSDETYKRFVTNPPPGAAVEWVNYYDNPWFPDVLEAERQHCEATEDRDTYCNIWEGTCRAAVQGAIYAAQVAAATVQRRITFLPYDPHLKVHVIWDMGFADNMAVIFAQRARSEVRVIDYIQVSGVGTAGVGAMVRSRASDNGVPYNFGRCFLPHDGFAKDRRAKADLNTDEKILKKLGFKVHRIPRTTVEQRIKTGREQFHRFVFDKAKCDAEDGSLLECLKRYRRADSKDGKDTAPVHDEFSHGADVFGYCAQVIDEMTNDEEGDRPAPMESLSFQPFGAMGY